MARAPHAVRTVGLAAALVASLLVLPAGRASATTPSFTSISSGHAHSCGLTTTGIVAC